MLAGDGLRQRPPRSRPALRAGTPVCEPRPTHGVESAIRLSDTGEILQMATAAAASREVEECRLRLECGALPDQERARLYCRLSETLYHRQSFGEAIECARTAFDLQPASDDVANLCAWVFSNCGRHEEA